MIPYFYPVLLPGSPDHVVVRVPEEDRMSQPAEQFECSVSEDRGRLSLALLGPAAGGGTTRLLEQFVATARRHGAPGAAPQPPAAGPGGAGEPSGTLVVTCEYPQWIDARVWPVLDELARIVPVLVVLTRRAGGRGGGPEPVNVPDLGVAAAVAGKLAGMSADTRRMLQVASTIGSEFGLLELARLVGCNTAALLPAVDEAMASGLVVSAGVHLTFSHEAVRAAVEASLCGPVVAALRAEHAALNPGGTHGTETARASGWEALSEQELHIARLVGRALTNQQIATRIGRSRHTVNYHLRQIFRKLGIGSRVELASLAQERARGVTGA